MTTRRMFMKIVTGSVLAGALEMRSSSEETPLETISWTRRLPLRYDCDVAVMGGGIAGASAAMAAARAGARVILVERFAVTGGNATVGGVGAFCGETAGQGEVFDAIVSGLEAFGAIAPYRPYPEMDARVFDCEILSVVLQELLLRDGIRLLLHTQFVDARLKRGVIQDCVVSGPSGPEGLRARQYIDCTGEAQVARRVGVETIKGRESDGLSLPMSMMVFVRHVEEADAHPQVPDGWFNRITEESQLPMTSVWPAGPRANAIKIKVPLFDASDTESMTAAEIQGRRRMMEVLDYQQRIEKRPWVLDHCAGRIGVREGRRILGDYVLTVDDLRAGRSFDDAIARGVYPLDGHKPDDDKRTYILPPEERKVPPYQVPFRSLLPTGVHNLLTAGRCFSADQLALSSARVMTTCSMMGQAAGVAAALSAATDASPRDLDHGMIRSRLENRGARL